MPISVSKPMSVINGKFYQGSIDISNPTNQNLYLRVFDENATIIAQELIPYGTSSATSFNFSATSTAQYQLWIGFDQGFNNASFTVDNYLLTYEETVIQQVCSATDNYRYGFNGMEKDDEVKGQGNSYTTIFRQYDPRLGRWLSIDPLTKVWLSPYCAYRNAPMLFIDPRGDDDIFSKDGKYLGSTKEGNLIRVITSDMNFETALENLSNNTKLVTEFNFCPGETDNVAMLSSIATYYAPFAGINQDIKIGYTNKSGGALYYSGTSDNFNVAVNTHTGEINPSLSDAKNLINGLVHEKKHQDDPTTWTPLNHVDAILAAVEHPSWNETTIQHKQAAASYADQLLDEALLSGSGLEDINKKIDQLNDSNIGALFYFDQESNSVEFSIMLQSVPVETDSGNNGNGDDVGDDGIKSGKEGGNE